MSSKSTIAELAPHRHSIGWKADSGVSFGLIATQPQTLTAFSDTTVYTCTFKKEFNTLLSHCHKSKRKKSSVTAALGKNFSLSLLAVNMRRHKCREVLQSSKLSI